MGDERLVGSLLGPLIWLALAVAGAAWLGRPLARRLGLVPSRIAWRWSLVGLVGFLCLSVAVDAGLRLVELREGGRLGEIDQLVQDAPAGLGFSLLALGLLPAICEELLFRGLAQRVLEGRFAPWIAVMGSSALFGLAHADGVHGLAAFLLGLYLGTVALWAGSVLPAVLLHAANNLYGVAALAGAVPSPRVPGAAGALALVAAAGLCLGLVANCKKSSAPAGNGLQREAETADS